MICPVARPVARNVTGQGVRQAAARVAWEAAGHVILPAAREGIRPVTGTATQSASGPAWRQPPAATDVIPTPPVRFHHIATCSVALGVNHNSAVEWADQGPPPG